MKKWIAIVLCLCLGLNLTLYCSAKTVSMEYEAVDLDTPLSESVMTAATPDTLQIKAKSAILMEPVTGKILYESNIDEQTAPASITKIMPLILVMEALERGDITLETTVTASEHACSMGGSQIWLEPGEAMTVDELLKAAVIASANDATVALGELIAGSEEGFVALMNEKAKNLGMNNTHFVNCTGLDAEGHLTTAHDVAIMSSELIKHELIKRYSTVWMDSLRDGQSELVNTNKLVRFYDGCTGLKTGTTANAGSCLSATAEKNGMQLVAVVLKAENSTERFEGAKKLLNYGFANFNFVSIEADLGDNNRIPVKNSPVSFAEVIAAEKLNLLLPKRDAANITQRVELKEFIDAPAKKGDNVGQIRVMNGESELGVIELNLAEDVDKLSFAHTLWWLVRALFTL